MRLAAVLPTLLSAGPALVSAGGSLGFAIGDKNADGSCKAQADWAADLAAIAAATGGGAAAARVVRVYAASDCDTAANVLPAAKTAGFRVVLGIWPDTDESYAKDREAVVTYAPKYPDQVYAITVGSETLYRGNFTGEELLAKIKDVKSAVPQFKVGTADSWNKFMDGTADAVISGGADILLCNGFSYWQGQAIANATASFFDDMMQAFGHIQSVSGSLDKVELWVGETGWPTAGTKYQDAVPGTDAAATFFAQAVCGILDWGFNAFFFEAFDEPWKPVSVGQDGSTADETHWGAMSADRKPKYSLKC